MHLMPGEQTDVPAPLTVFFSYAHKDERLCRKLEKHLSLLRQQGLITEWHDRRIMPGTDWAHVIDTHLMTAQVILLLISPDFLASDYCYGVEMQRALEQNAQGSAQVIPIMLRPVDWKNAPFAFLQCLPRDAKPITQWKNQDEALMTVAKDIRSVIEQHHTPTTLLPSPAPSAPRAFSSYVQEDAGLVQRQKQREWAFVRKKIVGQRMATCMVDILRLCCVRWSSSAYSSNVSRYNEFVNIAQVHFTDMRSSLEGLALDAEPSDYEFARKMELHIGWIIDKIGTKPEFPQEPLQAVYSIVLETHAAIYQFLVVESIVHKILKLVAEIEPSILHKTSIDDMNKFFSRRMAAQNELLKLQERNSSSVRGIWFDVDQELGLGYFVIDSILLRGRA
jgi:TIR domain